MNIASYASTLFRRRLSLVIVFILSTTIHAQVTTQPRTIAAQAYAPQAVTDSDGHLHLIYFKGDPSHTGDIFYVSTLQR